MYWLFIIDTNLTKQICLIVTAETQPRAYEKAFVKLQADDPDLWSSCALVVSVSVLYGPFHQIPMI